MKLHKKIFSLSMAVLAGLSLTVPTNSILAQTSTHTVQSGEYLASIAAAYGVSVEDLRAWNGLSSDMIYVGDVLVVDGTSTASTAVASTSGVHTVASGDTLSSIAQRYGTTVERLIAWNGLSSDWLNVGDQLVVYGDAVATTDNYTSTITSNSGYHTVVSGDTLSGIAAAYGVSESDLWAWNGLSSDWLNVGDVLSVSGYSTGTVTNTSSVSAPVTTSSTSSAGTHTVVANDSLYEIALAYGTTVDDLMAVNGLTSTFLQIGDVLRIPTYGNVSETNETTTEETTVAPEETTTTEAETINENGERVHVVAAGENLWRIANKYGVTVYNVRVWNNLSEEDTIQVGDRLVIKEAVYEAKKYKVTAEDTLESLAEMNSTSVENLTKWNNLTGGKLEVDSEIFVSDPNPTLHTVETGETLVTIADKYNTTVENLRKWNELPAAAVIANGTLIVSDPKGMTTRIEATNGETTTSEETTTVEGTTTTIAE